MRCCTEDIDLVADLAFEQTGLLASKLNTDFYADAGQMREAIRRWEVDPSGSVELKVASAEDTILEKLIWYKSGGQISDHQWSDVLGIATTQQLDREYLREWAPELGVADLLEKLFDEAGQIHLA
jgi:hypothetical protein